MQNRLNQTVQILSAFFLITVFLLLLGIWNSVSSAQTISPAEQIVEDGINISLAQTQILTITGTPMYFPAIRKEATPTATSTPTATATPAAIYFDDFNNSGSGWITGEAGDCRYEYATIVENGVQNGVYRITISDESQTVADRCVAFNPNQNLLPKVIDGQFIVRVRRTSSESRAIHYGFYFGAGQDAAINHWYLQVRPNEVDDCDGDTKPYFWLSALDDTNGDGDLRDDDDEEFNSAVCTDAINAEQNDWNILRAVRNGSRVDIYINDSLKESVDKDILRSDGFFDLVVSGISGLSDSNKAVIEYDYVRILGLDQ